MRQATRRTYDRRVLFAGLFVLGASMPLHALAQQDSGAQEQTSTQPQNQQAGQQQGQQAQQAQQSPQQPSAEPRSEQGEQTRDSQVARAEAESPGPYARPDDTWISISGTVGTVAPNSFTLDYGDGEIIVEMDDGDRDADAYRLVMGDKVTVNGLIDDDLFETTTIEASSVYVEKLGTYFYSSFADEEDLAAFMNTNPVVVASGALVGTVTEVDGDEFTLDTGTRSVRIDVEEMPNDPLDDDGYQRVEVGDRVSVTGEIDYDFFQGREIEADSITTLFEHPDV